MKRIALASILLVVTAMLVAAFTRDSVYWKRRALSSIYSAAKLPDSYYEPTEVIAGSDGPASPRVAPDLERLNPKTLQEAAGYAESQGSSALVVSRHGHLVFEKYWGDSSFDTVIDAGAFNATLATLAVGMAVGDRKIALTSEPVANYIESFHERNRASVTLDELLHMTSGLGPPSNDTSLRLTHDIRGECIERDRAVAPGSRWQFQPCDTQLLAHIVERATGMQYSEFISERLWKPIGAGDAWLMLDREGGTAHAACCLSARQGDWMRVAQLLVNDGKYEGEQILPPGWVRSMLAPSKANPRYGYNVWRGEPFQPGEDASEPYAADDTFVLKGNGGTRLWLVPSMSLSILRVGTEADGRGAERDDSRIPNLIIRGASDYVPKAAKSGSDVSNLVPNH
jgi:CubicO group peptidase (beta-lactamase class C family)